MPPADEARVSGSTRRTPPWLLALAAILLVARVITGILEERHPPQVADLVRWRPVADAVAEARQTKKPLLFDFTADWCPPCRAMQREMFADSDAAAQIEKQFVPVRVLDREREEGRNAPDVAALKERYHISAFPTLVVVSPDGERPEVLAGYRGKTLTLVTLREAWMRTSGKGPVMPFPWRATGGR